MKIIIGLFSVVGFLMVALPGPLYRFAGLDLELAFTSIRYGLVTAGAALILIILQIVIARKTVAWGSTSLSAALALTAVIIPLNMMSKAAAMPPIHDITTDITNAPKFVAIAPLRKDAPNPVGYAGGEVSRQQLDAYPEIKTVTLPQSINHVFSAATATVDVMGWELVDASRDTNTIEATDTSLWFGFKDDVVIRLTPRGNNTLVDVRSKSRVVKSDSGENAERILAFLDALRNQL